MVRPTQERSTIALTEADSAAIGDGTDLGDDNMDFDGGGTGGGDSSGTPPAAESLEVIADAGEAVDLDFNLANWWDITLTEDCILDVVNPPASGTVGQLHVIIRQGAGAPWDVTWPATVLWPDTDGTSGGPAATLHTVVGSANIIVLTTEDGGTSYDGFEGASGGNANDTSLVTVAATGSTETVDVSVARTYDLTLTANCTLTLTGAVTAEAWFLTLILRQDATGSRLVTWPGSVNWQGGVAPTLQTAAGAVDIVTMLTVDGGTIWLAVAGDSSVSAHIADPTDAHDASAISIADAGGFFTATDVEAALQELAAEIGTTGGEDTSVVINTATGTTETLDVVSARAYDLTLDNNVTITLTAPSSGEKHEILVLLRQDSTGSRTATWPAAVKWVGGSAPTLATSPYDVNFVRLVTTSGGTEWLGISDGAVPLTATPFPPAGTGGTFPLLWFNSNL